MIKVKKVLSVAALSALVAAGLASCGNDQKAVDEAAKVVLFEKDGSKVESNFKLPAQAVNNGKTYDLEWHTVDESSSSLISFEKVEADGDVAAYYKAVVTRPSSDSADYTEAQFYATVKYKKSSADTEKFKVRVHRQLTPEEAWEAWLTGSDGYVASMNGYVIAKVGYVDNYKEANLIVYDENGKGAFFIYNCYLDKDVYNSLELGTYVKIGNAKKKTYNGLIETDYGASCVVDTNHAKLDLSTLARKDISDAIMRGKSSTLTPIQSLPVEAKGFEVTSEVETVETTAGKYGTTMTPVATLKKADQEIDIVLMEGLTSFAADDTKAMVKAIKDKITAATKTAHGTYVNVKGTLSWNSKPVIVVTSAADVEVLTEAPAQSDYEQIAEIKTETLAEFKDVITSNFTKPVTGKDGDVTFKTELQGAAVEGISITDGVLTVVPGAELKTQDAKVTISKGEESITFTVTIKSKLMTDEEKAQAELDAIKDISSFGGSIALATNGSSYSSVAFEYKVADGAKNVKIENGKLVITPSAEAEEVKLTVTAKSGTASKTKEVKVNVNAPLTVAEALKLTASDKGTTKTVSGVVSAVNVSFDKDSKKVKNVTIYLGLDKDSKKAADKTVQIYGLDDKKDTVLSDTSADALASWVATNYGIAVGDTVVGFGEFTIYQNTKYEVQSNKNNKVAVTIVKVTKAAA
ncbi:MAG: hypothetical protein K6G28_03170 [Acholeplasmatales bacterium]|nr:hypothetical protein [Acholeplasmatales bacterium]